MARIRSDDAAGALELLRRLWGLQVDPNSGYYTGTFWEFVLSNGLPSRGFDSLAHAWGAGPTQILTEAVLGSTAVDPGYKTWTVKPQPTNLGWAQGQVPTPSRRALGEVGPGRRRRQVPHGGRLAGRHERRGLGAAGLRDEHEPGADAGSRPGFGAAETMTSTSVRPGTFEFSSAPATFASLSNSTRASPRSGKITLLGTIQFTLKIVASALLDHLGSRRRQSHSWRNSRRWPTTLASCATRQRETR